jgi:hypothetical protein
MLGRRARPRIVALAAVFLVILVIVFVAYPQVADLPLGGNPR